MSERTEHKAASSITVIGGADGPTSVFLAGKTKIQKRTFRQNIQKWRYNFRKAQIMKTLKANPHTMEETGNYIVNELGFLELDKSDSEYQTEYTQMRASFLLQYKPELLGELAELPKLEKQDEESVRLFMAQMEERQRAAEHIAADIFDIDLHIYEMQQEEDVARITLENTYGYIGGSASGSKKFMRKYHNMFQDIYRYYGVSQNDIEGQTKRYQELVKTLAMRG